MSNRLPAATPVIGMGATIQGYTDRHAATIVAVLGKVISVRRDIARRIDANGMSNAQSYSYAPDPNAPVEKFSLRSNGTYIKVGRKMGQGTILWVGHRAHYYDFSF